MDDLKQDTLDTKAVPAEAVSAAGLAALTGYDHSGSNLGMAKWLEANHDNMRQIYFDDWAEIVAEQKPLIEQLMQRDNTNNPLSAVIPVCKTIPNGDMSRLLLLAVATEMITRGHNVKVSEGSGQ